MKRLILNWCILLAILCGPAKLSTDASEASQHHHAFSSWDQFSFKIDACKCRVGIASVRLSVSELKPKDGNLVATYTIQVPLSKSSNDSGLIVLPIDVTVDELSKKGGVLRGKAYSDKEDTTPNTIICEIGSIDNKGIQLEIITDKRTLNFKSHYTVIDSGNES
jgi:hypothetical protein